MGVKGQNSSRNHHPAFSGRGDSAVTWREAREESAGGRVPTKKANEPVAGQPGTAEPSSRRDLRVEKFATLGDGPKMSCGVK